MSAVNVTNVAVLDNPSMFKNPFQFEISYECLVPLEHDLEWKLIYVGSAEDEKYDQILESVLVGPVNVGNYRFVFQADPPQLSQIPEDDIIGVTVLLLTCSYQAQEFLRVGYYVSNEYVEEAMRDEPPARVVIDKVQRNILAEKPRVTKFPIVFTSPAPAPKHIEPELIPEAEMLSESEHEAEPEIRVPRLPAMDFMSIDNVRPLQEVC
ncbi:hypothetical protein M758_12G182800 [Ceratodon purpureus]|nr:hypothetical protein M758_12G182800 [Ceratodon purpureus]